MSETTYQVGDKVTILDVKKVGEVIEVMENGQYQVRYTDDAGTFQTEICGPEKLGPVGESDQESAEKASTDAEKSETDEDKESEDESDEESSDEE